MRRKKYQSLLTIFTIVFGIILFMDSCVRSGLEECDLTKALIKFEFDYSRSGISRYGTTVIFYPKGNVPGGEIVSVSTHNPSASVSLFPGEYSVLVINESFGDFSNIRFRNTENYAQTEVYVIPVSTSDNTSDYPLWYSPEILVADTLSSFTVTLEMVEQTRVSFEGGQAQELPAAKVFTLRRRVATVNTVLHIKNMQYARNATFYISGFSEGHFLSSGQNSTTSVSHAGENIKLSYSDNLKANGLITGSFNTFGLNPATDATYKLVFDALLIDGKTKFHKEFDIKDIIRTEEDNYGITIDIELGSKENPSIEIPKVKPEEGTSPFDPEVDDWEEEEEIDIPV